MLAEGRLVYAEDGRLVPPARDDGDLLGAEPPSEYVIQRPQN